MNVSNILDKLVKIHSHVSLRHISFNYHLILLGITAANNQIVFTANKPIEFLKPVDFAHMCNCSHNFFLQ